jgi:hypothetical protein
MKTINVTFVVFSAALIADDAKLNGKLHLFARRVDKCTDQSTHDELVKNCRRYVASSYRKHAREQAKIAHDVDEKSVIVYETFTSNDVPNDRESIRKCDAAIAANELKASLQARFEKQQELSERERRVTVDAARKSDVQKLVNAKYVQRAAEKSAKAHSVIDQAAATVTETEKSEQVAA